MRYGGEGEGRGRGGTKCINSQAIQNGFNWISLVLQLRCFRVLFASWLKTRSRNLKPRSRVKSAIFRSVLSPLPCLTLKCVPTCKEGWNLCSPQFFSLCSSIKGGFAGGYERPIFSLNNRIIRFQGILSSRGRRWVVWARSCFHMCFYVFPPARNVHFLLSYLPFLPPSPLT